MWFKNLFKATDLCTAAKSGDVEAIERLVQEGHDVNAKGRKFGTEGDTPLHFAARHNRAEAVRILLKFGAKPNAKNNGGTTPLIDAAFSDCSNDVLEALFQGGASLDAQDPTGLTALDMAALQGNERLVAALLKKGANPNQERKGKKSEVLTSAIEGKNPKVFAMLLAAGAKPGASGDLSPAIQTAAVYGYSDYVEQLLKAGADPNTRDSSSFPTIMCAVRGKKLKTLESLIKAGADVNAKDSAGETALDIALEIKRKDMIELLEKSGAKRGTDLPDDKSAEAGKESTWQLQDDSVLTAWIEPWPVVTGRAMLKVTVSSEPELLGGWKLEYRIRSEVNADEPWLRMFPAHDDNDSDEDQFEADVNLKSGNWIVELRVSGRMHAEPDLLSDWAIAVR